MDDEVSVSDSGWGSRAEVSRATEGNSEKQGDDDLCGVSESGSYPSIDRDPAANIGVTCSTVSEREEFAQAVVGVRKFAEAILGATLMGPGVLGRDKRECDG